MYQSKENYASITSETSRDAKYFGKVENEEEGDKEFSFSELLSAKITMRNKGSIGNFDYDDLDNLYNNTIQNERNDDGGMQIDERELENLKSTRKFSLDTPTIEKRIADYDRGSPCFGSPSSLIETPKGFMSPDSEHTNPKKRGREVVMNKEYLKDKRFSDRTALEESILNGIAELANSTPTPKKSAMFGELEPNDISKVEGWNDFPSPLSNYRRAFSYAPMKEPSPSKYKDLDSLNLMLDEISSLIPQNNEKENQSRRTSQFLQEAMRPSILNKAIMEDTRIHQMLIFDNKEGSFNESMEHDRALEDEILKDCTELEI